MPEHVLPCRFSSSVAAPALLSGHRHRRPESLPSSACRSSPEADGEPVTPPSSSALRLPPPHGHHPSRRRAPARASAQSPITARTRLPEADREPASSLLLLHGLPPAEPTDPNPAKPLRRPLPLVAVKTAEAPAKPPRRRSPPIGHPQPTPAGSPSLFVSFRLTATVQAVAVSPRASARAHPLFFPTAGRTALLPPPSVSTRRHRPQDLLLHPSAHCRRPCSLPPLFFSSSFLHGRRSEFTAPMPSPTIAAAIVLSPCKPRSIWATHQAEDPIQPSKRSDCQNN